VDLKVESPRKVGLCIIIYNVDKNLTKDNIRNDLWNKNLKGFGLNNAEYNNKIMVRFGLKNKDPLPSKTADFA
jgi:hypothetical protein